jgi:protein SCO1
VVLTPDGRISHYFYGVEFPPKDLRLALVEASAERIGSVVDQILLFCFHYDPSTGRYGRVALNAVRAGGVLTLLALGLFVWISLRRDRRVAAASESKTT